MNESIQCIPPEYVIIGKPNTLTPFYLYPKVFPVPDGYVVRKMYLDDRGFSSVKLFPGLKGEDTDEQTYA